MREIRLQVAGREYAGWKRASVTRSIEAVAGHFELEVSDRWAGQPKPWAILPEDDCAILIDGAPVLTGYVDRAELSLDPEGRSLTVSGRDAAGDLVDCSADLGVWEFAHVSLLDLAKKLAAPHGLAVSLQPGLEAPTLSRKLAITPGESAFEALERACRMEGILPISDGRGGLVLSRAGSSRCTTALVEGKNIKSGRVSFDSAGRFRSYKVLAQHAGAEDFFGSAASSILGTAKDSSVRRANRTLVLHAENGATSAQAKRRAEWEAIIRAARGSEAEIEVQGWTQADGSIWPVNGLVRLTSPSLRVDAEALISEATYSVDDGGELTTLSLKRPDAFTPDPDVKGVKHGKDVAPWIEIARGV